MAVHYQPLSTNREHPETVNKQAQAQVIADQIYRELKRIRK